MYQIDLNSDIGENFGAYRLGEAFEAAGIAVRAFQP